MIRCLLRQFTRGPSGWNLPYRCNPGAAGNCCQVKLLNSDVEPRQPLLTQGFNGGI